AEIGIDARSRSDDILAGASDVVRGADARLNVVPVRPRIEAEVLEPDDAAQFAGFRGLLNLHEVRVFRLVEVEAGDEIVSNPRVDREAFTDPPVVLHVHP